MLPNKDRSKKTVYTHQKILVIFGLDFGRNDDLISGSVEETQYSQQ